MTVLGILSKFFLNVGYHASMSARLSAECTPIKFEKILSTFVFGFCYVFSVAAQMLERAFVAEARPGRMGAVVGDLMMAYKGQINLFLYFRSKNINKLLV